MEHLDAETVVALLGLEPHPEGGHFREVFRDEPPGGGRGAATTIYFLLREGEVSAWHRVDAVEIWHHYAGAPLELRISGDGNAVETKALGTGFAAGQRPHAVVPAHAWQSAASLGPWSLMGCTVAPAFSFDGFEMAPADWAPGHRAIG